MYLTVAVIFLLGVLRVNTQKSDVCPPDVFTTGSGVVTSPGWPSEYPHRWDCMWNITVPEGQLVHLQFTEFALEEQPDCNFDYVEIFDGSKGWSKKYCGVKVPPLIVSESNSIMINFKTDGSNAQSGFHAVYAAVRQPYPCNQNDVQAFVARGKTTVEVEINPGVIVNLAPGFHTVKIPTLNCSVKVIVNAASAPADSCPRSVSTIADPDTKLGVFSLSTGGSLYELTLPRGVYNYHYKVYNNDCTSQFKVFDSRLRRRLDFSAEYDVKCTSLQYAGSTSALLAVAEQKYPEIERLCRGSCKKSKTEVVSIQCANDTTTITWPTDWIFGGDTEEVPSGYIDTSSSSGIYSKTILSVFLYAKVPRVIYPDVVQSHLVPFCTEKYVYDSKSGECYLY